jgi:hypothetical protein
VGESFDQDQSRGDNRKGKNQNQFEVDTFEVRSKIKESTKMSKISKRIREDKKIAKKLDKAKAQLERK